MRAGLLIVATLALAGCSRHAEPPGAVTADEARQLNDAAAALDANSFDTNMADPSNESDPS